MWELVEYPYSPMSQILSRELMHALPMQLANGTRPWGVLTMNPLMQTVTEFAAEVYQAARLHWYVMPEREEVINHFINGLPALLYDAAELIMDQPEQNDLDACAEFLQTIWDSRMASEKKESWTAHTEGMIRCDNHETVTCLTMHSTETTFVPLPSEWLLEEEEHTEECLKEGKDAFLPAVTDAQLGTSCEKTPTMNLTKTMHVTPEPLKKKRSNSVPAILLAQLALGIWAMSKGPQCAAPLLASTAALTAIWASYDRMISYFMQKGHH